MSAKTEILRNRETKTAVPRLYAVIIHNDDYTSMDFVVSVLAGVFHKGAVEAEAIMLSVHNDGSGVAGVYPFDIAITKKAQAERLAADAGFPLRFTLSEERDYE